MSLASPGRPHASALAAVSSPLARPPRGERDGRSDGDWSEEEVLDVGPATVIMDEMLDCAPLAATAEEALFAQADKEKAGLAARIAELESQAQERDMLAAEVGACMHLPVTRLVC